MSEPIRNNRTNLITTAAAAARLGITSQTLRRYVQRGLVTPTVVLPSGFARWSLEDVDAIGLATVAVAS